MCWRRLRGTAAILSRATSKRRGICYGVPALHGEAVLTRQLARFGGIRLNAVAHARVFIVALAHVCRSSGLGPRRPGGRPWLPATPLLTLTGVDKHFGGLQVITDLDFEVNEEEIVGLIGPNGAGRSTVFNLITSIYPIDSGSIRFKDKEIAGLAPHKICHLGISRTYQLVRAFLKMSVYENVMTAAVYGGKHPARAPSSGPWRPWSSSSCPASGTSRRRT